MEGGSATITSSGTYEISRTLNEGQIIIDTKDEQIVQLILNNINLHSSTSGADLTISGSGSLTMDGNYHDFTDGLDYFTSLNGIPSAFATPLP